ncbi:hypothetical protein B0H16DRAFT_1714735 [Mycena metata]|uniref:F-box domain-containing protein n=1 Tax=Mycena metata TaxID=1033252 RepID=A0AAD7NQR7_9AGAR|nr:hypothetical protein B0H16DRAFT_1714735 [Mycena metata]
MARTPLHFFDLPAEILILILSSLNLATLASCLATNRRVKSIIDGSALLQYRLAAQAACVEDNPWSTTTNSAHKLVALQQRQKYFTEFFRDSSSVRTIEMNWQDFNVHTYALSGGIFAAADVDSGVLRWFSLAAKEPVVQQLELQGCIQELTLAIPEEDLLVVVSTSRPLHQGAKSLKIHFYEMSTQSVHRLARKPVAKVSAIGSLGNFVSDTGVDVFGSRIALLVLYTDSELPSRLLVYDWKQGRLLMDFLGRFSIARFLSLDVLVLVERETGALELWTIQKTSSGDVAGHSRISLQLPQLAKPGSKYIVLDAESNPKGSGSLSSQEPFQSSFTDSILLFQVFILHGGGDQETQVLDMVVSRRALLQLLPSAEEHSRELSWKEWGPPVTRWLDRGSGSDIWPPITCGQRHASTDPLTGRIRLLDFNPCTHRKLTRNAAGEERTVCTVSGAETHVVNRFSPGIFSEEITSQLGCVVADSQPVYSGVLLDESWIVGIKDTMNVDGKVAFDVWHLE